VARWSSCGSAGPKAAVTRCGGTRRTDARLYGNQTIGSWKRGLMTLEEVASRAGLPRSTTHRILDQSVRSRWLKQIAGVDHCRTGSGQCPRRVLVPLGRGSHRARRDHDARPLMCLARSPGGEREASRLAVLSWPNRGGINRMPGARNSLSRALVRASDSDMGISAFQWWAA
jgi:hypothetical protein